MCDRRGPEKPAANHRSSWDPQPLSGLVIQVWHPLSLAELNSWLYGLWGSPDGWHREPSGLIPPRSGLGDAVLWALGEGCRDCSLQGCRKGVAETALSCSSYSCRACLLLCGSHHSPLSQAASSSPAAGRPAPGFPDGGSHCCAGLASHLALVCRK